MHMVVLGRTNIFRSVVLCLVYMYMDIFFFSTEHTLHSDKHFSTISEITSVHTNSPAVTSPFTCTGHARAGVNRKQVLYCYSWLLSYRKYYEQLLLLTYFYFYFLLYMLQVPGLALRNFPYHSGHTVCMLSL